MPLTSRQFSILYWLMRWLCRHLWLLKRAPLYQATSNDCNSSPSRLPSDHKPIVLVGYPPHQGTASNPSSVIVFIFLTATVVVKKPVGTFWTFSIAPSALHRFVRVSAVLAAAKNLTRFHICVMFIQVVNDAEFCIKPRQQFMAVQTRCMGGARPV